MPGVARVGDIDSNHPPDTIVETIPVTVFVNGMPIAVAGDQDTNSPPDTFNSGSTTVFANGHEVLRFGDVDTNGDSIVTASNNVTSG